MPDAPAAIYAARYRAARNYAGLTQPELAKKLGVDAQTIKRRESGAKAPKKGERIAVAAICGVPVEFMEDGWGPLEPDEIRDLLEQQKGLLERIEAATRPLQQVVDDARDAFRGEARDHEEAAREPEQGRIPPASS